MVLLDYITLDQRGFSFLQKVLKRSASQRAGRAKIANSGCGFALGTDALGENLAQRWEAFLGELSRKSQA